MQPQSESVNHNNKSYRRTAGNKCNQQQPHLQQQQEQSAGATATETTTTTPPALYSPQQQQQQQQRGTRARVRVIKSKKPLLNFKFYLDIRDHQATLRVEEQIKALGGTQEFFLNAQVTHFITDKAVLPPTLAAGGQQPHQTSNNNTKNNSSNKSVGTPATPQTPVHSVEALDGKNATATTPTTTTTATTTISNSNSAGVVSKARKTRADALLSRALQQWHTPGASSNSSTANNSTLIVRPGKNLQEAAEQEQASYLIWQTDYALRFFKKVQHDLKAYLSHDTKSRGNSATKATTTTTTTPSTSATGTTATIKSTTSATGNAIELKGSFIKIESINRSCRPYYQLFRKPAAEWPKIELSSDDGAFRLAPKQTTTTTAAMTRKSRSGSSQRAPATPAMPAAVQVLRKGASATPTNMRNSTNCRQAKESSDKQCGVCEICKIEYDTLTIHLKTKDHEYFAKNSQNFIALDTLIHASADVNKFLNEEQRVDADVVIDNNSVNVAADVKRVELEEMEVEEQQLPVVADADVNALDPLEPLVDSACGTPSPPLRERSKRSTKGKHSSEKFQQTRQSAKTATPKRPTSSMLELQRLESLAAQKSAAASTPTTRKKLCATAPISPPRRAMLPPSSLYKVVGTSELGMPTSRLTEQAMASPSLIVKFKKVRQAELLRLNGEAENFMFPKQQQQQQQQQQQRRSSSDLPTDVDRQSTSDLVRGSNCSSSSLDSSINGELLYESTNHAHITNSCELTPKKSLRRGKQSFPSAPIQPEQQLKQARKSCKLSPPSAAAAIVEASTKITLPAATRKSSRTATAIVTAATTSSRLLRAAVEAVKKSSTPKVATTPTTPTTPTPAMLNTSQVATKKSARLTAAAAAAATAANGKMRRCRLAAAAAVVKMEDRMGDSSELNTDLSDDEHEEKKAIIIKKEFIKKEPPEHVEDDEDDDEEDEEEDDDDASDADYVHTLKNNRKNCQQASGRGRRRLPQQTAKKKKKQQQQQQQVPTTQSQPSPKGAVGKRQLAAAATEGTIKQIPQLFDYRQSERLQRLRYAFERLPEADLWYRVFARQDACEERYFEYFGETQYRKLPYELGPMPYDRTLPPGGCCKLCNPQEVKQTPVVAAATTSSYAHKHKKLHLLQRYRQEQQALLEQQQQEVQQKQKQEEEEEATAVAASSSLVAPCDSKASSLERDVLVLPRERAGSTSSCASSSATSATTVTTATNSRHTHQVYRNKHLSKATAAFLSLDMPPRKSPREHASTLALVSCLIKQRQESKPNSDADEPRTNNSTPTLPQLKEEPPPVTLTPTALPNANSPVHNTRSAAATPIEEMRFATEISENVKRMRRGQNKYDHSPPYVLNTSRRVARNKSHATPLKRIKTATARSKPTEACRKIVTPLAANAGSVRKTGQKKGVPEFEVDACALRALDAALVQTNVRQLERQIDQFLDTACKDYVAEMELLDLGTELPSFKMEPSAAEATSSTTSTTSTNANTPPPTDYFSSDFDLCDLLGSGPKVTTAASSCTDKQVARRHFSLYNAMALNNYYRKRKYLKSNRTGWPKVQRKKYSIRQQQKHASYMLKKKREEVPSKAYDNEERAETRQSGVITPPDSEIDEKGTLARIKREIDAEQQEVLVAQVQENENGNEHEDEEEDADMDTLADSIEDEHQLLLGAEGADADVEEDEEEEDNDVDDDDDVDDEDEEPPADGKLNTLERDEDDGDDNGPSAEGEEDSQTENNMVEQQEAQESKQLAQHTNYDEEEPEDEEEQETEDDEADYEPEKKRVRLGSSLGKALANCFSSLSRAGPPDLEEEEATRMTATTSTPSTHMMRGLRRTPQLMNGSLGSCISPSEKAGDNSDIFTVSSDGLDTDLDISNPHSQSRGSVNGDEQPHVCANHTPTSKRKYDISKYVPNPAANTCAAEAATAAAKSMAIAQFLKKEVRVTCRRIRAPFRRFRYRR